MPEASKGFYMRVGYNFKLIFEGMIINLQHTNRHLSQRVYCSYLLLKLLQRIFCFIREVKGYSHGSVVLSLIRDAMTLLAEGVLSYLFIFLLVISFLLPEVKLKLISC